jgi:hypothetical protein
MHEGVVPNTHAQGSVQIDFPLINTGLVGHVLDVGLLNGSVLQSYHSGMFVNLRIDGIFGQHPCKLAPHKFHNLKLDDPRISDKYRKILHKQFEHHNVYRRVKKISLRGKDSTWNLEDESVYENLDDDISEAMKHAERMCNIHKAHATPWTQSLGQATYSIRYWYARIIRCGIRDNDDAVLKFYLIRSNIDKERFYTTMKITSFNRQLKDARSQLKDVLNDAKSNGSFYEVEVPTARAEKKYPHLIEDNSAYAFEREEKIDLEIKARGNRWNTEGSFRKLGRQIQGQECFFYFSLVVGYPADPVMQSNLVFLRELALATVGLLSDGF